MVYYYKLGIGANVIKINSVITDFFSTQEICISVDSPVVLKILISEYRVPYIYRKKSVQSKLEIPGLNPTTKSSFVVNQQFFISTLWTPDQSLANKKFIKNYYFLLIFDWRGQCFQN